MKKSYVISILMLTIFLCSCSSVKVTSDQAKDVDFSAFKTYTFLGWQQNSDDMLNDMDKKRLHDAFKTEFDNRNLEYVSEGADMAVSLYLVINQETSTNEEVSHCPGRRIANEA